MAGTGTQREMEDSTDCSITFRFRQECDNEYIDEDNEYETCGNTIEIVKYASIQDYMDVEQEESD